MDTEMVILVGDFMHRENILTKKGLDILYNINCDPLNECLYYSVILHMTEMYGEIVEKKEMDKSSYQRLRKFALQLYIRFHTSKKQLSLAELREYQIRRESAFISSL